MSYYLINKVYLSRWMINEDTRGRRVEEESSERNDKIGTKEETKFADLQSGQTIIF